MKLPAILLAVLFTAAVAEDITTTDGRTYTAATITKVEPDGIRIIHESGAAKIPFTKLPPDLQKKHGYDPTKAVEFKQAEDAALAAQEAVLDKELGAQASTKSQDQDQTKKFKDATVISGKIRAIGKTETLVEADVCGDDYEFHRLDKRKVIQADTVLIISYPGIRELADKDRIVWLIHPTGLTQKRGNRTYREYEYVGPSTIR